MMISTIEKKIKPPDHQTYLNITQLINEEIARSGVRNGHAIIQTKHTTTSAVLLQEDEPGFIHDLQRALAKIAPPGQYYEHDDFGKRTVNIGPEERKNATSHIKASLLPSSLLLIVKNGQLALGHWQSVLFLDFDPKGRPERILLIQISGES